MTKVTITAEQAKAIESFRGIQYENPVERFIDGNKAWSNNLSAINGMEVDTFSRAFFLGYEIEQTKFEVGDWVVNKVGFVFKVDAVFPVYVSVAGLDGHRGHIPLNSPSIRLATKEEAFWAELGREVGEFRTGDIRIRNDGTPVYTNQLENAKKELLASQLIGFYPAESFMKFPTGNE